MGVFYKFSSLYIGDKIWESFISSAHLYDKI